MTTTVHASCVAINGRGVLLTGASGAGKSDLALRLIDRGASLVGDDGVMIEALDGRLVAGPGPNIEGQMEVRGLGILDFPWIAHVPLALVVALDHEVPRMPDELLPVRVFEGLTLPLIALNPFEASAAVKVEKALFLYGLDI
jgi:hypothetical protein